MKLMTVDEALATMLRGVVAVGAEEVPLTAGHGRTLAGDVIATRDQPPFAASAMDGWAVRAADCPGRLLIIGESAAGHAFDGLVGAGQAVRIFTGAPAPSGADAVVIQEQARLDGEHVVVECPADPRHIRAAAGDFRAGDILLAAGARLDPWRLALAAAAGHATLQVSCRPKVAVLSTGEEVVEPGTEPGPHQIFNSGTTALCALVRSWGGEPRALAAVGDEAGVVARVVERVECDLVVTLGGASVGDHDRVRSDLALLGLGFDVEGVAVRPGKPTFFGSLPDGRGVLGLPGNPASALVCAELFLRPLLIALQGSSPTPRLVAARATAALGANGDRELWMRARLTRGPDGVLAATAFAAQDSSLVTVFAGADGLLRRAADAPALAAGSMVDVLPLERMG